MLLKRSFFSEFISNLRSHDLSFILFNFSLDRGKTILWVYFITYVHSFTQRQYIYIYPKSFPSRRYIIIIFHIYTRVSYKITVSSCSRRQRWCYIGKTWSPSNARDLYDLSFIADPSHVVLVGLLQHKVIVVKYTCRPRFVKWIILAAPAIESQFVILDKRVLLINARFYKPTNIIIFE